MVRWTLNRFVLACGAATALGAGAALAALSSRTEGPSVLAVAQPVLAPAPVAPLPPAAFAPTLARPTREADTAPPPSASPGPDTRPRLHRESHRATSQRGPEPRARRDARLAARGL